MRTGKILGIAVGGIFALIGLLMLAVWLLVNPDHYKSKIAAAVKDATGRELVLQGEIKLSLLPWIALEVGPASLGNPAGFPAQPFIAFQHAAVRARLWPLLHERLEIARVEIDGLDVRLLKNAQGEGNWQGFGKSNPTPAPAPGAAEDKPLSSIAGITLTNARVSFEQYTLEHINLETAPFADGTVPVSLRFDANRGIATEHAAVEVKVDFSTPSPQRYRLAALTLIGQVSLANNNRPLRWHLAAPLVEVDLAAQNVTAPGVDLNIAGAQLNGELHGTSIVDDVHMGGSVTLAPLVVREFLPRFGLTSPVTRDPRAFAQVAGSLTFAYGANALNFDSLRLTLDQTHVQGRVAVTDLKTRALQFALTADAVNVDHYRAPEAPVLRGANASAGATPVAASEAAPTVAAQPAHGLVANGTIALGALHVGRLDLTDVNLTLAAKDGIARVFPLTAQLDGGRYSGDVTLDSSGVLPSVSVDEHLSGVEMGTLLASNGKSIHLSGKGTINVKATGRGAGAEAILNTLNGHADAYVAQGAVEGVDLGFELGRAEALLRRESQPAAQNTQRTTFDAFKTSAEIVDGVATTRDLLISSQALKITGEGSTNLKNQTIDFELLADTLRSTGGVPIQIPVKVTGTTANPTVRPDIEALAKGQLRQKLQDVLHDKLKGLFGKP